eukprot:TRINITY_DN10540_c0_g1_i2.p2 TRINITY_DN10540_c0_g1~~TRINITY_DN10540_c0_g1_i2.p2  ORF type:complete len:153 (+),score=55.74 TRINITY_DN10540_c0_g1_i2:56-460(+)
MRCLLLSVLIVAVAAGWDSYKLQFNKNYETAQEEAKAHSCFLKNLQLIDARNALGHEKHGLNHFSDICEEDFKEMYLGAPVNLDREYDYLPLVSEEVARIAANSSIDWRTRGAVTPVKNQRQQKVVCVRVCVCV